ncbi:MAG TPA: cytidine deaminase [Gemmatimonadaceae bacterium]|nr:cytidine deaminase [Gemmatimonadaceae bacterium]
MKGKEDVINPDDELRDAAFAAMENAYAPYSRFRVGAALRTSTGEIVSGCNVENAAYGEALCAERVAVSAAVARGMREFDEIAIASESEDPAPPCGSCRQTMSEFAPDLKVTSYSMNGKKVSWRLSDLLPEAFALNYLRGKE